MNSGTVGRRFGEEQPLTLALSSCPGASLHSLERSSPRAGFDFLILPFPQRTIRKPQQLHVRLSAPAPPPFRILSFARVLQVRPRHRNNLFSPERRAAPVLFVCSLVHRTAISPSGAAARKHQKGPAPPCAPLNRASRPPRASPRKELSHRQGPRTHLES